MFLVFFQKSKRELFVKPERLWLMNSIRQQREKIEKNFEGIWERKNNLMTSIERKLLNDQWPNRWR